MKRQIGANNGICFFEVEEPISLARFLAGRDFAPLAVAHGEREIRDWFDYGCVYLDGKRQREDLELSPGQIVRVHTRRKSYWPEDGKLRERIVHENGDFLILDKPAGLPTHPTLDNYRENAKFLLEKELERTLYVTHRLDVPTQGLLLLAKTLEAQRQINTSFSRGRVDKTYRSLNEALVAPGRYAHSIDPETRVPRAMSDEPREGWWRVELEVLRSGPAIQNQFWHEIRLLTGKTHQIRAQMSFLKAPIVGDEIYGAEKTTSIERIALECFRLSFTFRSRTFAIDRPQSLVAPHIPPMTVQKF